MQETKAQISLRTDSLISTFVSRECIWIKIRNTVRILNSLDLSGKFWAQTVC